MKVPPLCTVAPPLPAMPLDLLAGRVFGPPLGTLCSVLGAASFFGMLPLTFVHNSAGDLVLGNRWLSWIGGGVMVVLFFLFPHWIERYDLFSLRRYFTHEQADQGVPKGVPDRR